MNRFASTLILAAAPLLAVGMVTQSESTSANSTAGVSSIARNSDASKQSFRGYWLDGSNFTQDAGYSPNGLLSGGNFPSIMGINSGSRQVASMSINSHQNLQRSEKTVSVAYSTKSRLEAQLANFNALYAYLTTRGGAASAAISPAVYRQLMDQQFAAHRNLTASGRAHFTYGSIVSAEKKSVGVSAADLQMVGLAAQHTEHAADIRDVSAARLKKTMQQRIYVQHAAPALPNRLSGQNSQGRGEQNRREAFAAMQVAYAGTKVFTEIAPLENLRRMIPPAISNGAGCENPGGEPRSAEQIELKAKIGAPIK